MVASSKTQCLGAHDHLLRIGNIGRSDLVDNVCDRVAQHALRADVEQLNNPPFISRDDREIGAAENGVLQGPHLQQKLAATNFGGNLRRHGVTVRTGSLAHSVPHFITSSGLIGILNCDGLLLRPTGSLEPICL